MASRAPRATVGVLVSLGTLLALPLLAEVGLRGWRWIAGDPYSPAETARTLRGLVEEMTTDLPQGGEAQADLEGPVDLVLHPYFGFDRLHGQFLAARFAAESRSPERERELCVLLLGGSVAEHFGSRVTGGAGRLIELLEEDPRLEGRRVRIRGFARSGYKQPQQLLMLAYLLSLGCRPDVVVEIDGYNELALTLRNAEFGQPQAFPSVDHWGHLTVGQGRDRQVFDLQLDVRGHQLEAERQVENALGRGLHKSALLGGLVRARLQRTHAAWAAARDAYARRVAELLREGAIERAVPEALERAGPSREPSFDTGLSDTVDLWFESSLSMHDLCARHSIRYMHVLQPTTLDPGAKELTPGEQHVNRHSPATTRRVAEGYPALRERGAELVAAGVEFRDFSRIFADEARTLFYDPVHFNSEGNAILARGLARAVLDDMR